MSDDALLSVAEEQLRWLRAAALPQVRETIDAALPKTEMRRAFELCDGTRSGVEISKSVGVSNQSVSNWTRRWRNLGIAYEIEGGTIRHLVSLDTLELSLDVE